MSAHEGNWNHTLDGLAVRRYLAPDAAACVESPAGAMGVHAVNVALAGDTVVDPLRQVAPWFSMAP